MSTHSPLSVLCERCCGSSRRSHKKLGRAVRFASAKKEIWRLRLNWLFFIILAGLASVSYTSILSSFHQFITNPKPGEVNETEFSGTIEPGLGESEAFYSLVIASFNVGKVFGAVFVGVFIRVLPYWHLILVSLLVHTLSYVIYALTTVGWLIVFSKLLSGTFLGTGMTLAFTYFGESYENYQAAMKELGKDSDKKSRVKDKLYALHSVGVHVGYLFGPGVATIFAQFDIDQFRSIAWYNVAAGVALIILQLVIFHGESSCHHKVKQCKCSPKRPTPKSCAEVIGLLVVAFVIVSRGVLAARFVFYETLFNPILSDDFGFTERTASYFFLALVTTQIGGSIILLVMQQVGVNSRRTVIIGLLLSICSSALMADWQSIRHDPCTEYSLFHHPELIESYKEELQSMERSPSTAHACQSLNFSRSDAVVQDLTGVKVYVHLQVSATEHASITALGDCWRETSCMQCNRDHNTTLPNSMCLPFTITASDQLCLAEASDTQQQSTSDGVAYSCNLIDIPFSVCVSIPHNRIQSYTGRVQNAILYQVIRLLLSDVHTQSLQLVEHSVYQLAQERCVTSNYSKCHWTPNSQITKQHCDDCQPICRSIDKTLDFIQFCLGAALFMIAVPLARDPMTGIIADTVSSENVGVAMGTTVSLSGVVRGITPLWITAAYEGVTKRTFLPVIIMTVSFLPILFGMILLYQKLAITTEDSEKFSRLETDDDTLSESSLDDEYSTEYSTE